MSTTDDSIQVRAAGDRNLQVTGPVKDGIFTWLEDRGVSDARDTVVLYHRGQGEYVSIHYLGVSDVETFNTAYSEAVEGYWRNQAKTDDVFWLHRYWIEDNIPETTDRTD